MDKNHIKSLRLFQNGVPEDVLTLFDRFQSRGYQIYLVGGAVRDSVLYGGYEEAKSQYVHANGEVSDLDFTTNATPEEIVALFRDRKKASVFTVPTGLKHGTITIVMNGAHYEVTTFRIDGIYVDGRRPQNVEFSGNLEEDLARRDFTINAMAYDVLNEILYDPFGGLSDLENRLIRTVGDPMQRFEEDGLRPLRACRFAAQLNFQIEEETLSSIPKTLDIIQKVSMERVRDEIIKMMLSVKPSVGIEYMRKTQILELLIPELLEGYGVEQNEYHKYDVYYHNLYACDTAERTKPLVRLAALLHDIGKPRSKNYALSNGNGNVFYNHEIIGERMASKILKRLKFSNYEMRTVLQLIKMHMFYYTEDWGDGAVRRFIRKVDADYEFLLDLFELRRSDRIGSGLKSGEAEILDKFRKRIDTIIEADNALKITDLKVNGYDIMEGFSIKPSRIIGELLNYLLECVLDNPELNEHEKLMELAGEYLKNNPENPQSPKNNIDMDMVEKLS